MSRALLVLDGPFSIAKAQRWCASAPHGTRVEFKAAKRSLPENDKLWAMLTEVSEQAEWSGKKRTPAVWKDLFTAAFRTARDGLEVVPGLEGGFMLLGLHTSDLGKDEMSDLLEYILAWGAQNDVRFKGDVPAVVAA